MIANLILKTLIIFTSFFLFTAGTNLSDARAAVPAPPPGVPPPEDTSCSGFLDCIGIDTHPPGIKVKFWDEQDFIGTLISDFLPAIFGIAGFITVIIIVISGIQFITSSGNPEAAAAARGRLIFALVGFALIILAFAILQIVNRIFLGNTGVA